MFAGMELLVLRIFGCLPRLEPIHGIVLISSMKPKSSPLEAEEEEEVVTDPVELAEEFFILTTSLQITRTMSSLDLEVVEVVTRSLDRQGMAQNLRRGMIPSSLARQQLEEVEVADTTVTI